MVVKVGVHGGLELQELAAEGAHVDLEGPVGRRAGR